MLLPNQATMPLEKTISRKGAQDEETLIVSKPIAPKMSTVCLVNTRKRTDELLEKREAMDIVSDAERELITRWKYEDRNCRNHDGFCYVLGQKHYRISSEQHSRWADAMPEGMWILLTQPEVFCSSSTMTHSNPKYFRCLIHPGPNCSSEDIVVHLWVAIVREYYPALAPIGVIRWSVVREAYRGDPLVSPRRLR